MKRKYFEEHGTGSWKVAKAMRKVCKHSDKETATRLAMKRYWKLTYYGSDREHAAFAAWYAGALDKHGIVDYNKFLEYYTMYFENHP